MDGHVASLLAMSMLEKFIDASPNGSEFIRILAMINRERSLPPIIERLGLHSISSWRSFVVARARPLDGAANTRTGPLC